MPLFEYECQTCHEQFEAFVTRDRLAECPACQSQDLQKLLSSPGMVGQGGGRETQSFPACGAQGGACACKHSYN